MDKSTEVKLQKYRDDYCSLGNNCVAKLIRFNKFDGHYLKKPGHLINKRK